jgi:autotransporter-associated beta strand protein
MKPKFRSLAAAFAPLSRSSLIVCASLCAAGAVHAASGTWTGLTSPGNWSDTANWNGGVVADGAGFTADLSTVDLPAGAFTVNLDTNRSIQSIIFGDTDAATTAGTWTLGGTTTLTLDGTSPTLTAGVASTIAPVIAGTAGMTKDGAGNLILTNANTFTGGVTVSAGQLTIKNGAALGPVSNTLTLANGTTFRYERAGSTSQFAGYPITVAPSSAVTITTDNAANGYYGVITGDAASTVTIGAAGAVAQCSFSAGTNTQQFGPFLGTVEIFDGASIRFSSTSALNNGGASALFDTNLTGDITARNSGTVNLGSLVGNGSLTGSGGATGTTIFSVGGRGEDCIFGGIVRDGNTGTGRIARLTKVGAGKLTLTGASTYTGQTNIDVGTLEIGNGGTSGSIGATNLNVASGANLDFNPGVAQVQTVSGVIAGAGNVTKKGAGRTTLTGVNTFSVGPVIEEGVLAINADSGLGNAANAVNFSTGSGKLGSDAAGVVTARAFTVDPGATGGFAAIDATDSLQVDGVISGDGALAIGGAGLVVLTADNTYLGNTTVASGILSVTNASGSATSSGSVAVTGGVLGGTGAIGGAVSISSGAGLKPGGITTTGTTVGNLTTGTLDLNGGSTLYTEFANASSSDLAIVNGNLLTTGASAGNPVLVDLRLENSAAKWTNLGTFNLIQYSGTFTGNANDLFEVSPGSTQGGLTYTFAASGGFITVTISGSAPSEWNVDSGGNWSNAANWLNGVPNQVGATAKFAAAITSPATVTVDTANTVGAIQFNNANSYTVAGTFTLSMNASSGNANIEILSGNHEISAPLALADSVDLSLAAPTNTLTLSGDVAGAGGLKNATAGAVVLNGTNTFGGGVDFSAGSLTFGTGSLGTGSLSLADSTLIWEAGNTEDISSRTVTVSGTSVTMDTNGGNVVLANAIGGGGAGGLIKAGAGSLVFSANPTYTGSTTISGGTLQLGNGGTTGVVSGTIVNNAQLSVKLAGGETFGNLVTGTGSFVHEGSGTLTLTAQNTFSGTTSISSASGTLVLTDALNLQNSTLNYLTAGGTLDYGALAAVTLGGLAGDKGLVLDNLTPAPLALTVGNNNQNSTYSGVLSGTGSLTKLGTGVLTLTGANTYTGATASNGGDLEIGPGGATDPATVVTTGGTGRVVVNGGDLSAATGNFGVSTGGLLVSAGSATFSGTLTAAGSTGSSNSALIKVTDGTLNAPSIVLGRTGQNATNEPAAAAADTNLYMIGGAVHISGDLLVGTGNAQPNSTVVTRVDGGVLTVGGAISVGLNNGGRWSILDINGGDLVSTATAPDTGVVLGGPFVGKSAFLMRAGTATVERIQFGRGALDGSALLHLSGGELYLGSGGIEIGTTGAAFVSEFRFSGGTLGAKADWSTSLPINMPSLEALTIKAANLNGDPFDITLGGALTGTGGLEKDGDGTLTLAGGHSYLGNTTVLNGVLKVQTKTFDDAATVGVELGAGAALDLAFGGGDRVAIFKIDGNQMADGIYGSLTNATPGITQTAAITGPGLLYVNTEVPPSGYDSWASSNGLTAGNNGPNDDPDNDGIDNLLEFVLGGLPLVSSTDVLPDLAVDANNFVFTFNRNDDSEAEVALVFQYGSDLAGWTDVTIDADGAPADGNGVIVNVGEGTPASNPDAITVTVPRTQAVGGKLFGRVVARK